MTEKIKGIIWDMGGVILRTTGDESRQALAKEFNISTEDLYRLVFDSPSAEKATIGMITEIEHWNIVADTLGMPREKIQELQDRFWAGDQVDKELISFIKGLNENHKTGLLSNAWSGARQALNQKNACDLVFKYSMFSYEVRLRKPDPKIYERMLELMGLQAREAIFVDDLMDNVKGAESIGIHGVQFISTNQAIADVKRLL
jgi:HAD superfamily hydrolase (TIGR01509 family)